MNSRVLVAFTVQKLYKLAINSTAHRRRLAMKIIFGHVAATFGNIWPSTIASAGRPIVRTSDLVAFHLTIAFSFSAPSDRSPCPCPPFKAAGAMQIPRTIRRHLDPRCVEPAFLMSPSLNTAAPRACRHSSLIFTSLNSSQADSLGINRDLKGLVPY